MSNQSRSDVLGSEFLRDPFHTVIPDPDGGWLVGRFAPVASHNAKADARRHVVILNNEPPF